MPRLARGRKSNIRRKPVRKARISRPFPKTATAGSAQRATIVETIEFRDLPPNQAISATFCLSQFPRASTVSGNFAFYKAAKVVWTYEPLYNTFQDAAGSASVPYLYTVMNRSQLELPLSAIPWTRANAQATGALPQKLSKKITVGYKPNWCSPGLQATITGGSGYTMGSRVNYGWLTSQGTVTRTANNYIPNYAPTGNKPIAPDDGGVALFPLPIAFSSVNYNGHMNYIDQEVPGEAVTPTCRLTCTVHWLFKGAAFNGAFASAAPPPPGGPTGT
jgi:hypothetical protein